MTYAMNYCRISLDIFEAKILLTYYTFTVIEHHSSIHKKTDPKIFEIFQLRYTLKGTTLYLVRGRPLETKFECGMAVASGK